MDHEHFTSLMINLGNSLQKRTPKLFQAKAEKRAASTLSLHRVLKRNWDCVFHLLVISPVSLHSTCHAGHRVDVDVRYTSPGIMTNCEATALPHAHIRCVVVAVRLQVNLVEIIAEKLLKYCYDVIADNS